jgi:pimaricinolide synthase PimS1
MAGALDEAHLARLTRSGIRPLATDEGLALFDAAMRLNRVVVVPARFDFATMRNASHVPELLSGLVSVPVRRPAKPSGTTLRQSLATMPADEQAKTLLDLVLGEVAIVLGHSAPGSIPAGRAFSELGFDSLVTDGQQSAAALDYAPLPDDVVQTIRSRLQTIEIGGTA